MGVPACTSYSSSSTGRGQGIGGGGGGGWTIYAYCIPATTRLVVAVLSSQFVCAYVYDTRRMLHYFKNAR